MTEELKGEVKFLFHSEGDKVAIVKVIDTPEGIFGVNLKDPILVASLEDAKKIRDLLVKHLKE
jgi:hypothetical protein